MNRHEEERIKQSLRQAMPPIADPPEPAHDLWPAMLRRMSARSAASPWFESVPWFDWVLVSGLAVLLVLFPTAIPLLLYYL